MKGEEAGRVFMSGFNCAQSVLLPFASGDGIGAEEAAKIASSFGAGMGRLQETCGAVTGAFMALGLEYGFISTDDPQGKARSLEKTRDFASRFRAKFGTLKCRDLLGLDLNTDEGQEQHKVQDQREKICRNCVAFAAATVEEMMAKR
jgi:C_GCAxxG_C_C family probable redox protein